MKKKKAFITGVTGQDGSYMVELLLEKGYEVHALIRRTSVYNKDRIAHLLGKITLHVGDLTDHSSLLSAMVKAQPDELYNFAAQSFVAASFDIPEYTLDTTGISPLRLLEIIRHVNKDIKFYQASSSEMFGNNPPPQNETTPFYPASPYGVAKVAAYHAIKSYREAYGIFAVNGVLFNHESPRRGEEFVTRKISLAVARIKAGKQKELRLGNLEGRRDWGYAPEYIEAAWQMLQYKTPEDFVIATGEMHTVREFVEEAFKLASFDWKKYVRTDEHEFRPREVEALRGDSSKAAKLLGWRPKTTFKNLVRIMVEADCKALGVKL